MLIQINWKHVELYYMMAIAVIVFTPAHPRNTRELPLIISLTQGL
jgi:hypothetical protein